MKLEYKKNKEPFHLLPSLAIFKYEGEVYVKGVAIKGFNCFNLNNAHFFRLDESAKVRALNKGLAL